MSPLPVPPSHLRPTCHLEREARQQSLIHQAVFHLPVLHKAPAKRYHHLTLFGVTRCHVTRSREKILGSVRSDSHSHRIQLWNANQHPSLFTIRKICHKNRHILTNFVHEEADMQYLIPTSHFMCVLQCSAALNQPGPALIQILLNKCLHVVLL